jgi:hypothetical protein
MVKIFWKILQCEIRYVTMCSAVLSYKRTDERNRRNRPLAKIRITKRKIASVKVNFRRTTSVDFKGLV